MQNYTHLFLTLEAIYSISSKRLKCIYFALGKKEFALNGNGAIPIKLSFKKSKYVDLGLKEMNVFAASRKRYFIFIRPKYCTFDDI